MIGSLVNTDRKCSAVNGMLWHMFGTMSLCFMLFEVVPWVGVSHAVVTSKIRNMLNMLEILHFLRIWWVLATGIVVMYEWLYVL